MIGFAQAVASKLNLPLQGVSVVLELLAEGATIPFIARYRKDRTGALDEVQVQQIQDTAKLEKEFAERKEFIIKTVTEQEKMTVELMLKINSALTINELEDIYLPYKPKRKTKGQTAKENGLEPLADLLLTQVNIDIHEVAAKFINDKIADEQQALQGARDIIAEKINENADLRATLRNLFEKTASVQSKVVMDKEEEAIKYKDYFDFSEQANKIPSHRFLAILRGFMEGYLRLNICPDEEEAILRIEKLYIQSSNESAAQVKKACKDAYKRLLLPSLESELRMALKIKADEEAIIVFAENLRQLLLSSPLGNKRVLAIDPGYRTGCKIAVLDEKGDLLKTDLVFVHEKNHKLIEAEAKIKTLISTFKIDAFAIGDGTAGRETEQFVKKIGLSVPVFLVNEDGASVYSASEIAREEFPEEDLTVRGAVSIGRRLMDPLAELVKIDPKSIGVGQYQHDVNQSRLKEKLDQTVESCVNAVGVNLNTAGKYLLSYVSGIGPSIAENIVRFRAENGKFTNRKQLLKVPRLGAKAYEQCAGFLRIKDGENPLDASGVHPETYPIIEKILADTQSDIQTIIGNNEIINQIQVNKYMTGTVGKHTIEDILKELKKPGLDPRDEVQNFEYAAIFGIEDVQSGMVVPGIITNLTRFGVFVDIGVKQDGLVHISEIAHQYISDPSELLKLNQKVMVKVTDVDVQRKRISLSIKQTQEAPPASRKISEKRKQVTVKEKNITDALVELKSRFDK